MALRAQQGDLRSLEALLNEYKNLVRAKVGVKMPAGLDRDDLIQEGMIGLFKAVRAFRPGRGASFKTFAEVLIDRQILSAIRSAQRKKHVPLKYYVPLEELIEGGGVAAPRRRGHRRVSEEALAELRISSPLTDLMGEEESEKTLACFRQALTELESRVIDLRMLGFSYREIADRLKLPLKSVDNALQRAKTKFDQCRG